MRTKDKEDTPYLPTVENMMKLFDLSEEQALVAVQGIVDTKQRELVSKAIASIHDENTTLRSFLTEFESYGNGPVIESLVEVAALLDQNAHDKLRRALRALGEAGESSGTNDTQGDGDSGPVAELGELHKRSGGQWFDLQELLTAHPKRFKGIDFDETKKALIHILVHRDGVQETGKGKKLRTWRVETEKGKFRITNVLARHL